jgi:hypothetical protein
MRKYIFILLVLVASGCIPINDEVNPEIRNNEIGNPDADNTFFYLDTLNYNFQAFDNGLLDTINVKIEPARFFGDSSRYWFMDSSYSIRGRLWTDTLKIGIPATNRNNELIRTGEYVLTLTVTDDFDNPAVVQSNFTLGSDVQAPDLDQLDVLFTYDDGSSVRVGEAPTGEPLRFCRNQSILFDGAVLDNIALRNFQFSLSYLRKDDREPTTLTYPPTLLQSSEGLVRSITLDQLAAIRNLRVPANVANGTLELSVIVSDLDGNSTTKTFPLIVDCDDEAPSISISNLRPRVREQQIGSITLLQTDVVQGGYIILDSVNVIDNAGLSSFHYTLRNASGAVEATDTLNFENETPPTFVSFGDLRDTINFSLQNTQVGAAYTLRLGARDTVGLRVERVVDIRIIEDEPPEVIITGVLVNDLYTETENGVYIMTEENFDSGDPFAYLMINGKIKDGFQLSDWSINLFDISSGSDELINSIPEEYVTDENGELILPINIPTYIQNGLTFPVQRRNYRIDVSATDSRNQTTLEQIFLDYRP